MRSLLLAVLAVVIAFSASGCSSGPGKAKAMDDMEPMEEGESEMEMPVLSELSLSVLQPQPDPDGTYSVEEGETFEVAILASPAPEEALQIHLAIEVPEHLKDYVRDTFQATESGDKLAITFTLEAMVAQASLSFQPPDDQTDRADATLTAELLPADHYTLSGNPSVAITVTDNDDPTTTTTTTTTQPPPPPPPPPRTLSGTGGETLTWGDSDGPPTDGSLTKVTLTGITVDGDNNPQLAVDRGGAVSCTMTIDAADNPGNTSENIQPGEVRLDTPDVPWTEHTTVTATFDAAGDRVTVSEKNGDTVKIDVSVTC